MFNVVIIFSPDSPPVQSPLLRQMMKEQHELNEQNKKSVNDSASASEQNSSSSNTVTLSENNQGTKEDCDLVNQHNDSNKLNNVNGVEGEQQSIASGGSDIAGAQFDDINWTKLLTDDSNKGMLLLSFRFLIVS